MIKELWIDIPSWNDLYEVSDQGNVRSKVRQASTNYGLRNYGGKLLKPIKCSNGYMAVNLANKHYKKQYHIHYLVLRAFIGSRPLDCEACHNNGMRDDNRLENLRWDTKKSNHADKKLHGTWQGGEKANNVKLKENEATFIKYSKDSAISLAKKFNISKTQVLRIKHGEAWGHI